MPCHALPCPALSLRPSSSSCLSTPILFRFTLDNSLTVGPPTSPGSPQTLGPVLRGMLPSLFPSSRDPVLANVVLHGAPVPFSAPLEELMREAAYPDGWLCLIITLL